MLIQKKKELKIIYLLSILFCIYLHIQYGRQWGYDTISYIKAWDNISNLQIDLWRTPVYPIFIGITKIIFGDNYLIAGVIIQYVVFFISIGYFYILSCNTIKNNRISWWLTAIYALYPCIPTWNCFIQTEAFAIYSMVFLLYYTIKMHKFRSIKNVLLFLFWFLFHIFLRPSQVFLIPIFGVGFLLYYKKSSNKSNAIKALLCIIFASICMLFYSYRFYKSFGVFAPCGIGVLNKYSMLRKDSVINEETIQNSSFRNYIIEKNDIYKRAMIPIDSVDLYKEAEYGIETFGLGLVSAELSHSTRRTIGYSLNSLIIRIQKASNDHFLYTYLQKWTKLSSITDVIGIRLNILFWLLFIFTLLMLKYIGRNKIIPWFTITLLLIAECQLLITIIACQDEWGRLIMPAISVYLIIFGLLLSTLQFEK